MNDTSFLGTIGGGVVEVDAIRRELLSVLKALKELFLVVFLLSERIGFLDAATRRGVIPRHREPYGTAVAKGHLLLHETLTEGAATDDRSAVVILHSAGEDLRCRCREIIDKDGERHVFESSATIGFRFVTGVRTTFGIDDHLSALEELVCHTDCLIHISAAILAQIHDIPCSPLHFEFG